MATATTLRTKIGVQSPAKLVEYLNIFTYGDSGSGKTYFLGTAQDHEETRPLLILDVEGGILTLRKRKDIDVKPVRSMKDVESIYDELRNDTTGYYKTVGIDSLTELQKLDMKQIMEHAYQRNPEKVDKDVPSQREWGKSGEHMRSIVRAFRDLPCNTIMTALAQTDKEEGQPTRMFPDLPGKLRSHIPGFVDIVGYLHTREEKDGVIRIMQFEKTRRVIAKDRTDALGSLMENPTIPLMWERIKG